LDLLLLVQEDHSLQLLDHLPMLLVVL